MSFINKLKKKRNINPTPYSGHTDESSDEENPNWKINASNSKNKLSYIVEPNLSNIKLTSENITNSLSEKTNTKMSLTLTLDPLKYIEKLNSFDGRREDLYTFITNVDGITPTLNKYDDQSQTMCINILKSKLIGKAKRCIEIHSHLQTWKEIKELLIENFGGFKSSFQLYDELRQTPYKGNVTNFYNDIQRNLCELNQKTVQEGKNDEIPHNTQTALNIFKERLPVHMRTVLFALKPSNLQAALHELSQAGFLNDKSEDIPKKLLETPKNHSIQKPPQNNQNNQGNHFKQHPNNFVPRNPTYIKPPFNYHNPNPNYKGQNYNPNYKPPSKQAQPMEVDPTSSQLKKVQVNHNNNKREQGFPEVASDQTHNSPLLC